MTYDSENSQNTIQTQEQAIDENNNSKDTQYNQNSNTTSTIRNNNLTTIQITNIWTCQIKNGEIILGMDYHLVKLQIRDVILNGNYEEITHWKF